MNNNDPITSTNSRGEAQYAWLASDDRGVELEIVAVEATDTRTGQPILLVIHLMPNYRRKEL